VEESVVIEVEGFDDWGAGGEEEGGLVAECFVFACFEELSEVCLFDGG